MSTAQEISLLNEACFCFPLDRRALDQHLLRQNSAPEFAAALVDHTTLFASTGVLITQTDLDAMLRLVRSVEAIATLPGYRKTVFNRNQVPAQWHTDPGAGLFMGYDFHITDTGPKLIEVNTNAGGAFLVAGMSDFVRAAHLENACAGAKLVDFARRQPNQLANTFVAEFGPTLEQVWIVDEQPQQQYLYPDMLLAQLALTKLGLTANVVDVAVLPTQSQTPSLVYNRSTDFYFAQPQSSPLTQAMADPSMRVSPGPIHHALYADKRNLLLFAQLDQLRKWGLDTALLPALAAVPAAQLVAKESQDSLWAQRKSLFFKPASGYGSQAVYRGDKLTKRVWSEIASKQDAYIAQDLVPPARRSVQQDTQSTLLKYDVRLYTYAGQPLLAAARVYQGQTTNFRTPGGGFAPLFVC